jgi:phosphoglycerate-specific signal transduction histidine kinase
LSSSFQNVFSQNSLQIKSLLGSLLELVESWILSISQEDEKARHLEELRTILEAPGTAMNPDARRRCLEHLQALERNRDSAYHASPAFRQKLQGLFSETLEKLARQVDQQLKSVGDLCERLKNKKEPAEGLTMRVDFCLENLTRTDQLKAELSDLKDSIIRSLKDIRRFIFDLRPMALDDLGLVPTLEQFLTGFKTRTGYLVPLILDGTKVPISPDKELAVFRVIQEAVNNANRHAHAKNIIVFLTFSPDQEHLECAIKDDGTGFNVEETRRGYASLRKLGLISMEERIKLAGGEFSLISGSETGTVVSFHIPLP